jgi:hypothetical protein
MRAGAPRRPDGLTEIPQLGWRSPCGAPAPGTDWQNSRSHQLARIICRTILGVAKNVTWAQLISGHMIIVLQNINISARE